MLRLRLAAAMLALFEAVALTWLCFAVRFEADDVGRQWQYLRDPPFSLSFSWRDNLRPVLLDHSLLFQG